MERKLKAAEDSALKRMQAICDAKDTVRPWVGEVRANLAQDDADDDTEKQPERQVIE